MKRRKRIGRRGFALPWQVVIALVLLVLFLLLAFWSMLKPLFSREVQLSASERWCQASVVLNRYIRVGGFVGDKYSFPVICSTERLKVGVKDFKKEKMPEESVEEGSSRYILDYMRRCKFLVGGDNMAAAMRDTRCYICYTLETSDTIPPLTAQQIAEFSLFKDTEKGERYVMDIQSTGSSTYYHQFLIHTESVLPNKRYAVVYVDHQKPYREVMFAKPVAGCIIGGQIGSYLPVIGTGWGCVGGIFGGSASALYDALGKEVNVVALTELKDLTYPNPLQCGGFVY